MKRLIVHVDHLKSYQGNDNDNLEPDCLNDGYIQDIDCQSEPINMQHIIFLPLKQ
jgi:hypothetical protein